jgi:hypothetical protein
MLGFFYWFEHCTGGIEPRSVLYQPWKMIQSCPVGDANRFNQCLRCLAAISAALMGTFGSLLLQFLLQFSWVRLDEKCDLGEKTRTPSASWGNSLPVRFLRFVGPLWRSGTAGRTFVAPYSGSRTTPKVFTPSA